MRSGWNRATAVLDLSTEVVEALVCEAIPEAIVVAFEPVEGGLANTNIKVEVAQPRGSKVLLKIFVRDPETAPKEYALNQLVCQRVCTPKFLHFSPACSDVSTRSSEASTSSSNASTRSSEASASSSSSTYREPDIEYPYAVIEWVDGTMLQSVFPHLSEVQRKHLGESVGSSLAKIHSFKFPNFGFFDGDLNIKEPIAIDGAGLLSYVRQCLVDGPGGKRIGAEITERLIEFLERQSKVLDLWNGEPCLTHSDFNHSNILVAAKESEFEVAAVLDWEFAFSGTPFFDFGNLLRAPIGSSKAFVEGVEYGYKQAGGALPSQWRKMSLLSDLTAWAEFMTRDTVNENLIADAARVIEDTIRQFDKSAV